MTTITAAVSRPGLPAPVLESVELEEPRADEILVRIVATGICHSDINCHAGRIPVPQPIVLGHEGAGIVERVGVGVAGLEPGDHVVLSGGSCGICPSCRSARPTYCREAMRVAFGGARLDGTSPVSQGGTPIAASFFGQSSFATYAIAPARTAVKIPRDVPLELMAPLACGVITGAGSVLQALALRPGQSIAVFGTGGVGLSAIMAARLAGGSRIVAVDVNPARLELARELGATDTVLAGDGTDAGLRDVLPEGFDLSFVTADQPVVYTSALGCLAPEGTMGFVAGPRGDWTPDLGFVLSGGRRIQGIIGGSANPHTFIPAMIEYWRQGRLPFDRMVERYDFADIATAWSATSSGAVVKPVLVMDPA
jgi:aryl-alcohol dehydrogenase